MSKRLLTTIGLVLLLAGALNAQDFGLRQYQYWLDDDFAGRSTTDSETLSIDIADLASGAHFLNVLCYYDGTSNCYRYAFYKKHSELNSGAVIQSSEYWIDDDYEGRTSFNSETLAIDISGLSVGAHFLSVLCYATDGTSGCYRYAFYKRNMEQEATEDAQYCYWIDDDYDGRTTTTSENLMIDISGLPKGPHFFNAMQYYKDGTSSCYRRMFYIAEDNALDLVEAWIDGDYTPERYTAKAKDGKAELSIDISELDNGKHWLNLMARNVSGSWNIEDSVRFVKRDIEPLAEGEWAAIVALHDALVTRGWKTPWDVSQGEAAVYTFDGLQIAEGYVIGLDISDNGFEGAVPAEVFAFRQLEWLNISHNKFTGNVGLLAQALPEALTTLNVSDNCFDSVWPMVSPDVELTIGRQSTGKDVHLNITKPDLGQLLEDIPNILLYDHKNQTFKTSIDILVTNNELTEMSVNGVTDWAIRFEASPEHLYTNYVAAPMVYHGKSGDRLYVYTFSDYYNLDGSSFNMLMSFEKGDANMADGIDAADLQTTIRYIFNAYYNAPFNFNAADTYEDENINVQDVVCTVDILLSASAPQQATRRKASPVSRQYAETSASVFVRDGHVVLSSDVPVAAFSIKMSDNTDWDVSRYGMMQSVSGSNMVCYSLSGATLPAGETVIGTCGDGTFVRSISAADIEAKPISVMIGEDTTTGISHAAFGESPSGNIYDAAGKRYDRPTSGINIIKGNRRAVKVIKKANK